MRMRAAVLEDFDEPLEVQEVELTEPGPGEVLVRLEACGVCHTDLYTASGADPSGYAPTVLGHEGAGVVEKLGPDVDLLREGDHVVTLFSPQCGECVHCRDERTNLCLAIREQQNKGYLPDGHFDKSVDPFSRPSRWSEGEGHFAIEIAATPEGVVGKATQGPPRKPSDRSPRF